MPFWIALIYQGARAGGLQEAARVSFEAGALHFPDDFIDTDVGREINDQIADEKVKHYNRYVCYFGFLFTPWFDAADKALRVRACFLRFYIFGPHFFIYVPPVHKWWLRAMLLMSMSMSMPKMLVLLLLKVISSCPRNGYSKL